ncbi:hypothetical protein [Mucilaginibacter ginsenosidivorans]|uniref:Uncharacterized protein n=1 Tax=Mucilaginibacter ginsenosidivorans TaxID=398053 RepID=A0A5B8UVF8_9SPHI|nr:hypothetical protein [Mucilaginibacter ginsenosidivorans]QEC63107.1 hypothetical protein FRZ54_11135 [Mucilaginibacter ginsenosidivorans]
MNTVNTSYWTNLVVDIITKQGASFEFAMCIISKTPGFVLSGVTVADLEQNVVEVMVNTISLDAAREAKLARAN